MNTSWNICDSYGQDSFEFWKYLKILLRAVQNCKDVLLWFRKHLHRPYSCLYIISFHIYLYAFAVPFLGHSTSQGTHWFSHFTAKQTFGNTVTALFCNAFWVYLEVFWVIFFCCYCCLKRTNFTFNSHVSVTTAVWLSEIGTSAKLKSTSHRVGKSK